MILYIYKCLLRVAEQTLTTYRNIIVHKKRILEVKDITTYCIKKRVVLIYAQRHSDQLNRQIFPSFIYLISYPVKYCSYKIVVGGRNSCKTTGYIQQPSQIEKKPFHHESILPHLNVGMPLQN